MTWPLPDHPFVPGKGARPVVSPAFDAADAAPAETQLADWAANATYLYGFDLYAAGFFWEAHEVWEPVWMRAAPNSRARALVHGLIQLANACLKLEMDRPRATGRLLAAAEGHMAAAGNDPLMGMSPPRIASDMRTFGQTLDIARRPALIPRAPD